MTTRAIIELEKAKKWCEEQIELEEYNWCYDTSDAHNETQEKVIEYLTDQINKLKKEQG